MISLSEAFENLKIREIEAIITKKIEEGVGPYALIKECQNAMEKIGRKFETGEYFLGELIISAKMFEKASELLTPMLRESEGVLQKTLGKIVLGSPRGDIHDIGKNIFRTMAEAAGFEVIDLGIDVLPELFIDAVKHQSPQIVGMSGLLTTTFPSMKEVVDLLSRNGLRKYVKVIIGGGATGEEARRYVGADAQTLDANKGVQICKKLVNLEISK